MNNLKAKCTFTDSGLQIVVNIFDAPGVVCKYLLELWTHLDRTMELLVALDRVVGQGNVHAGDKREASSHHAQVSWTSERTSERTWRQHPPPGGLGKSVPQDITLQSATYSTDTPPFPLGQICHDSSRQLDKPGFGAIVVKDMLERYVEKEAEKCMCM